MGQYDSRVLQRNKKYHWNLKSFPLTTSHAFALTNPQKTETHKFLTEIFQPSRPKMHRPLGKTWGMLLTRKSLHTGELLACGHLSKHKRHSGCHWTLQKGNRFPLTCLSGYVRVGWLLRVSDPLPCPRNASSRAFQSCWPSATLPSHYGLSLGVPGWSW